LFPIFIENKEKIYKKKKTKNKKKKIMQCEICLNKYDHSRHKPYFLSCPHTFCIDCLNRLQENKCPACQSKFQEKFPKYII
jgi:hypothetical protein